MTKSETNPDKLLWVDMEMSGIYPEDNVVLEIALLITDNNLNIVAKGPVIVIHQNDDVLNNMDEWNTENHNKTGLVQKAKDSKINELEAENIILEFLKQHATTQTLPLCGNSVHHDRRFLIKYLPRVAEYIHYRIIDVSSIKELTKRWYPDMTAYKKQDNHTSLSDIIESIEELKYYRSMIFK